jgi:hypothetical protein
MSTWELCGLIASAVQIAILCYIVLLSRDTHTGTKSALQNVQLQLAFIAGRIGLRNQDLQTAAIRGEDPEKAPPPEVIGGSQWNDFEELIDRAEKGEVNLEETPRGR